MEIWKASGPRIEQWFTSNSGQISKVKYFYFSNFPEEWCYGTSSYYGPRAVYGVDRSWDDPMITDHNSWTWTVGHTPCYTHGDPVNIMQSVMCITVLTGQRLWELSALSKIPAWTWHSQDWNPRPCRPGSLPHTALLLLTWNIIGTDRLPCSMMSPRLVCLCTKKKGHLWGHFPGCKIRIKIWIFYAAEVHSQWPYLWTTTIKWDTWLRKWICRKAILEWKKAMKTCGRGFESETYYSLNMH